MKNKLKLIIKEYVQKIFEIDFVEDNETNVIDNVTPSTEEIETAGLPFLKNNMEPKYLNLQIEKILNGRLPNVTVDNTYPKGKLNELSYMLSTLASLYKNSNDSVQQNIKNFVLYSIIPKGENSMFLKLVGKKAGFYNIFESILGDKIYDILLDVVIDSSVKALDIYDPEKGVAFLTFLTLKNANDFKSQLKKLYSNEKKGERVYVKKYSLDAPMRSGNDGETTTYGDMFSDDDKNESEEHMIELFSSTVNEFIKDELLYDKKSTWIDVYEMLIAGYSISETAKALKIGEPLIKQIRARITKQIDNSIKSGELRDYVKRNADIDINSYPKIKEVLKNGKFSFAKPKEILNLKEYLEIIVKKQFLIKEIVKKSMLL